VAGVCAFSLVRGLRAWGRWDARGGGAFWVVLGLLERFGRGFLWCCCGSVSFCGLACCGFSRVLLLWGGGLWAGWSLVVCRAGFPRLWFGLFCVCVLGSRGVGGGVRGVWLGS